VTAVRILFVITAALIMLMHAGTALFKKKIAEILGYVNLCLHIVLLFERMALEATFEFMALSFMLSLLVYLLLSIALPKIRGRRKEADDV